MKRLKNLLFTMLLALLAWNCQKEEVSVQDPESFVETESKPFDGLRTIALEEVPDIEGFLSSSLSKRKGYAFKKDNGDSSGMVVTPFGQIPLEDILEVTDTLGNFNYTFRILPNSYIGNRFYNLVIHKKEGEKDISAFVVEYHMNEGYAQDYMAKTAHFGQFSGKVRTYGFEAFLDKQDKKAVASKACEEEKTLYSLEPCEEYELENGEPNDDLPPPNDPVDDGNQGPGGPGGGGGGGGGGDMPPGPGVMCAANGLYVSGCGGTNSDELHAVGLCQGPNMMGGNFYMQYYCSDGSTKYEDLKAGDCADGGAGPVGIAPVPFNKIALSLGLDFAQQQWLEVNCELKNDLYQFLNAHLDDGGEWQTTAEDFAREALDAWMDGGEVDFEEKIIYLLEDYPCQKNIIQDLIVISAPISELFQEIFVDNNRAQIVFKVENLPQLEGGNTRWVGNNENTHLFEITLNSYRLENSTNLDVINTIVHEYTHAVLLYFFYASPSFDIDLNNPPSYAELVQQFSLHRQIIGGNNSPSQHEYMANLVSDIAEICLAWSEQNNLDYDLDYLIEIAWGGMTGTETFNILYPEGSDVRFNVIEAQTNEIFPNSTNNEVGVPPCD